MSLSEIGLNFYRKTVKRFQPAHKATHWVMTHGTIPFLENRTGFHTIADDPFWFRLELLTNRHEKETIAVLDQLARPGMTMLDVGAHVGYYSCRYARFIGTNGRIFAFEPHPRTFAILQQNVAKYTQVTAVQAALSESTGTAELHDYLIMSASGSLHYDETMLVLQQSQMRDGDVAPRLEEQFTPQTFSVQTVTGDQYLADQGIEQVDIIKMDIEGAEISALRGLRQTIAQSPDLQLVMEYNPAALTAFGHEPVSALTEVLSFGFNRVQVIELDGRLSDITRQETAVTALTEQLMTNMGVVNLLFSSK